MWIDDRLLERAHEPLAVDIWRPHKPMVVLGAANKLEKETKFTEASQCHVPIYRRYGGGGTVVLYPGCLVLGMGLWVEKPFGNGEYFARLNQLLIDFLRGLDQNFAPLQQKGISDITYGEKKVAGTSIFRSRHYLLYQVSLLVDLDLTLIEELLSHPTSEPDYRKGRGHGEFLAGISDYSGLLYQDFFRAFRRDFYGFALRELKEMLKEPEEKHMRHLLSRLHRSVQG